VPPPLAPAPAMAIHIFDVEHGACAAIVTPSGRLMMIDCGHNSTTGWRPWAWVQARGQSITNLAISNFDEDHLSDLPNIRRYCQVDTLTVNWDVSPDWLVRKKTAANRMGPGVGAAVAMMREYDQPSTPGTNDWGTGFSVKRFWHPPTLFSDENSLSVVTFIHCGGVRIVFSGDMTRAGWCKLLEDSAFVAWLQSSNILVAPHHGRADGYCPEMFRLWSPQVVIISDKGMMYDTQEVNYGQHAKGITWNKTEKRRCLTTRSDGKLTISNMEPNSFWIDAKPTA
jgi:beta-lactamase superfamily II metal-dependent hydrolase